MQTETLGFAWGPIIAAGAQWLATPSAGGEIVYYDPPAEEKDNTMTYVGIGVAALAGVGLIWALAKKKKKR